MKKTLITQKLINSVITVTSQQELKKVCKDNGIELNEKSAEKWFAKLNSGELAKVIIGEDCPNKGGCPKCGSRNITQHYIPTSPYDGYVHCHCNVCDYSWTVY